MTSWETTLVDYSLPRGNRLAPRAGCIDVDDCERCKSRPAGDEGLCSECVDAVDERHTYDDGTRRISLGEP